MKDCSSTKKLPDDPNLQWLKTLWFFTILSFLIGFGYGLALGILKF